MKINRLALIGVAFFLGLQGAALAANAAVLDGEHGEQERPNIADGMKWEAAVIGATALGLLGYALYADRPQKTAKTSQGVA